MRNIIDGVIILVIGTTIVGIGSFVFLRYGHWIAWPWRRYRAHRDQRRAEQQRHRAREDQRLNEIVKLTTDEVLHWGCTDSGDEIIEPRPNQRIVGLGSCRRCGESLSQPRAGS